MASPAPEAGGSTIMLAPGALRSMLRGLTQQQQQQTQQPSSSSSSSSPSVSSSSSSSSDSSPSSPSSASSPSSSLPTPPQFVALARGDYAAATARQQGKDEARAEYEDELSKMHNTVRYYQRVVTDEIEHAKSFQPELSRGNEQRIQHISATLDRLESYEVPAPALGASCSTLRVNVARCVAAHAADPLACSDLVRAFATCADDALAARHGKGKSQPARPQ